MANQRISGTCYITVDGEELNLSGSLQIPVNKYTRQAVTASGRVIGYSETPVVPSITGNFYVDSDFPLEKLRTATDMTIVARSLQTACATRSRTLSSRATVRTSPLKTARCSSRSTACGVTGHEAG